MGHDSYEFMGRLYPHRMVDWLRGEPWYFYFVLLGVKLPTAALLAFAGGVVLLFRRATGDGRYFLLFWLLLWGLTFIFAGGKFTRYATSLMPAVIITAALAIQFARSRPSASFAESYSISRLLESMHARRWSRW
jgi:4-amino-4-deoxy-L-arabinose transferase-like glycosyltransferase